MRGTPGAYGIGNIAISLGRGTFDRRYNRDSNKVLDALSRIEQYAEQTAKKSGVPVEKIYDSLGFDPLFFQIGSKNDAWLKETEEYLTDAMDMFVPKEHGIYGEISGVRNLIQDDNAILGLFEKPKPLPESGGEPVKRREITPKESYLAKIKRLASEHPYITLLGTVIGTALFLNFAPAFGLSNPNSADSGQKKPDENVKITPAPTAKETPQIANFSNISDTPKHERYLLNYKGIDIVGNDPQFIKDVVLALAFMEKYSPPEDALRCTNEIEEDETGRILSMAAIYGHTDVNASEIRGDIEGNSIETIISNLAHEDEHSCRTYDPKSNTEENADKRGIQAWNNLLNVTKKQEKKFIDDFNFSKLEPKISKI